jgi:hypothetical protein
MPGEVSRAYQPAVCRCQHLKEIHSSEGPCAAPGCLCRRFRKIPAGQSAMEREFDRFLNQARSERHG